MSRIGRKVIAIPKGVTVTSKDNSLTIKGPKGQLEQLVPPEIGVKIEGEELTFSRASDDRRVRALHGLSRALANNMVEGVTKWLPKEARTRRRRIQGGKERQVGSVRAWVFAPDHLCAAQEITIDIPVPTQLTISGIDKQLVGAVAAKIRSIRPPEPYKGKGVKYSDETIRRKAGKTAGK